MTTTRELLEESLKQLKIIQLDNLRRDQTTLEINLTILL